ncbi:peroxiredoxin [Evansella vedderi]|uniref:Peroxiredoxin n=1 Tax=Evansella vedderi TaxID=38282 RepID=A0ABT9ZNK9_9BACI|nr:redoxin domain-containing protein [Evansella vedderi]MDQ0252824.1 peroxiredoxin [Evansella vedderi]
MYCTNCGTQNSDKANFCQSCGEQFNIVAATVESTSSDDLTERVKLERFVGSNQEYYFYKWQFEDDRIVKWGFNWSAMFLGFLWLGYRKMYFYMFCLFLYEIAVTAFVFTVDHALINLLMYLSTPIILLIVGGFANRLYYNHAKVKITEIEKRYHSPRDIQNALLYKGGTSLWGLFGGIIASTILILGIAAISLYHLQKEINEYYQNPSYLGSNISNTNQFYINESQPQEMEESISISKATFFEGKDLYGNNINLADFQNKNIILYFWGTYNPTHERDFPFLNNLYQDYKNKGLEIIAINVNEEKRVVDNYLREHQIDFTVVVDENLKITELYGVSPIPAVFLIHNGEIVNDFIGPIHKEENKILQFVANSQ